MDVLTYKDIPATVAFHINEQTLRKIFSGVSLGDTGYIIAVDDQNQPVFFLCEDEFPSSEKDLNTLTESVLSLSYDDNNTCIHDDTHIMRIASKTNDWTFYLVRPIHLSIRLSDYFSADPFCSNHRWTYHDIYFSPQQYAPDSSFR